MAEFILKIGNQEADTLETALLFHSFSSLLQQCFLIMLAFLAILIMLHNKNENAPRTKKKHSHKHSWKRH